MKPRPRICAASCKCTEKPRQRAVDAGFDIVYLHGTHGTLPVQALSRHFNRRTDGYGGSFENRARLWLEILEAMRQAVKGAAAIANRFSIDQLSGPQGIEAADEGLAFVELVTRHGLVDLWDVNISSLQEWGEDAGPSRFYKTNHQAPWTREVKKVAKVPVVNVGRFTDPGRDGARASLRPVRHHRLRPPLDRRSLPAAQDRGRPARRHQRMHRLQPVHLPLRAQCARSSARRIRRRWRNTGAAGIRSGSSRASTPRHVAVVGAGPAGLECALMLGRRGHEVELLEATPHLGGHLRDVVRLPGLAEWGRVISWRETAAQQARQRRRSAAASAW